MVDRHNGRRHNHHLRGHNVVVIYGEYLILKSAFKFEKPWWVTNPERDSSLDVNDESPRTGRESGRLLSDRKPVSPVRRCRVKRHATPRGLSLHGGTVFVMSISNLLTQGFLFLPFDAFSYTWRRLPFSSPD